MENYKPIRAIISGGGTGGHIFPAISIADSLRAACPRSEFLFVGAEGKMEMQKVPEAGYRIVGLPVVGLQRQLSASNLWNDIKAPLKYLGCLYKAGRIISDFRPDVAIGVGGYASAPLLRMAQMKGIPTLLQEQNSFAGLANRHLAKKAGRICTAYEGMEKFFPVDKIVLTGNPIRAAIANVPELSRSEGSAFYSLDEGTSHILLTGGSLGSRTLNEAMKRWISDGCPGGDNVQVLWQCGKYYLPETEDFMEGVSEEIRKKVIFSAFIARMDLAYAAADLVIARSGASTVSELCAAHKAAIFVPSPNVAEDHQTHNAMALVSKDAAMMVRDKDAVEQLLPKAVYALMDRHNLARIGDNAGRLALPDAGRTIADEVYRLIG